MSEDERYWFTAKRYGWGWGPPATWQGWLVLATFVVIEVPAAIRLLPRDPVGFVIATSILTGLLLAICYLKGEPPSWRWGDRER
jgi:hypothetical protein